MKISPEFIHAWGGTTSIQSLEGHTLRYLNFKENIGNRIVGSIYCDITNHHHTVYFEKKDIVRWNNEGKNLIYATELRKEIIAKNLEQIKKFFTFYKTYNNTEFKKKNNAELLEIYTKLIYLIMENGSFFPYSREEITKPIKEKIMQILGEEKIETFYILTTPIEEDIFIAEKRDRINLYVKKEIGERDYLEHAKKHPWRFINTYSEEKIIIFLKQEQEESNLNQLKEELIKREKENLNLKKKQEQEFRKINNKLLEDLCIYMQKISTLRLENKKIWAGYEFLFLDLFIEISKLIGISIKDLMYTYRIEEIKEFLKNGKKLSAEDVERRQMYFNMEINPNFIKINYIPQYNKELEETHKNNIIIGEVGNLGHTIGKAIIVTDDSIDTIMKLKKEINEDYIYVTTMTHPAMVPLFHQMKGIITDEGGVTSHAAIIAREFGIPCLVGTKNATKFFKNNDIIELDTYNNYAIKLTPDKIQQLNNLKSKTTSV